MDESPESTAESQRLGPGESVLTKSFLRELGLLGRHIALLKAVRDNGPIGIIRLSASLAIPPHKVRYSLRILEKEGYIKPSTQGAMTTEKVDEFFIHVKRILQDAEGSIAGMKKHLEEMGA